ncbi:spore cortex biosynthesis protein YabQ [Ornithinibacillus californiensis]|uniref:spore cortex biosynthesis protein YabQ n=1 Tax=Ornithinibacillus californiensis TaxID=161536 RepID=UPI00064DCBCD|nr:spore cortex biosynthesis protein YabQ [Ornithinibacillus californiensis]
MTLSVQFLTMVSMITGGLYLGMALDTFRRFHRHWKHNVFLVYVMEVSFWLTQMFILYFVLFQVNSGELRFYVFAACLLGFATYQVFVATLYKRLLERMILIASRVYQIVKKLVKTFIVTPIVYIFQLLIACVVFLFNMIMVVLGFVLKCIYFPLKWILVTIYRLLPKKFQLFLHHLAGFYSKIQNICRKGFEFISSKRR